MAALPDPPSSRRARATYEGLIGATREVLRRTGTLAPEAVGEEAAVSPATFYAYFSSKDAALAAAFDAALEEMYGKMSESLSVEALLEEGLEGVVRDTVRMVVRGFTHDARVFRLAISRLPESELIRDVYREREEQILSHLTRFIRLGAAAGKVRDTDPVVLARAALVSIQGLQNPLLQQPGTGEVVDELVGMLVALLRPA